MGLLPSWTGPPQRAVTSNWEGTRRPAASRMARLAAAVMPAPRGSGNPETTISPERLKGVLLTTSRGTDTSARVRKAEQAISRAALQFL